MLAAHQVKTRATEAPTRAVRIKEAIAKNQVAAAPERGLPQDGQVVVRFETF